MDRIKFRLNTGRRILKHFEILDGLEDQYVDKLGADGYIRKTTHKLMNKVIEDDKKSKIRTQGKKLFSLRNIPHLKIWENLET